MTETNSTPTPTSVYKYYDINDLLLYVGITSRRTARQGEHNADKEWWPFVVRQAVEHYPSREEAERREIALIRKHQPPFNKRHNHSHAQARAAYMLIAQRPEHKRRLDPKALFYGRGRVRVEMDVMRIGNTLLLTSRDDDAKHLMGLDPTDLFKVHVSFPGGRATLDAAYWDHHDRLNVRLICRSGIESCTEARVTLRGPNGSHRYPTIKLIELRGPRGMQTDNPPPVKAVV